MKKQPYYNYLFLFLFIFPCIFSCKSGSSISHQDSLKIKAWDQLFTDTKITKRSSLTPFDQPVKYDLASDCFKQYKTEYGNNSALTPSYTYAVGFQSKALGTWLSQKVGDPTIRMDEMRICFGLYTPSFTSTYTTAKPGRLTVFLWPYFQGNPAKQYDATAKDSTDVDPFNLGSVYP